MQSYQKYITDNKILFATNADITPGSTVIESIQLYKDMAGDSVLCEPSSFNGDPNNIPTFGMTAFFKIISKAAQLGYKYVVYVDADCFIWSQKNLFGLIRKFVEGDYIYGGVPDGGVFCHRNTNNYAINPFLSFFNIGRILKYVQGGRLSLIQFDPSKVSTENKIENARVLRECEEYRQAYQPAVPYMKYRNFLKTNTAETAYTYSDTRNTEFYYPLFLGLYHTGEHVMYVHGRDYICEADPSGLTSGLYANGDMQDDANLVCLHTWFSRVLTNRSSRDKILIPDHDPELDHENRIMRVMQYTIDSHTI